MDKFFKKTFDSIKYDEPRIIIPLYYQKRLIGYQGRSIGNSKIKYITVMLEENVPKIYGYDSINKKLPVYVVEGPFDSTFINNSVALCGSDGDVGCLEGSDIIFVYDNEPRNQEIVRRIGDTIDRGNKVVIWPNNIIEKDINDMVLSGLDVQVCDRIKYLFWTRSKTKVYKLEKNMSNQTKVKKRDGRIESLDLEKMHIMVENHVKILQEFLHLKLK
jgi:DNA primase